MLMKDMSDFFPSPNVYANCSFHADVTIFHASDDVFFLLHLFLVFTGHSHILSVQLNTNNQ